MMTFSEANDLAQKLLVNLAQDLSRDLREDIGAIGIVQIVDDLFEHLVIDVQVRSYSVRFLLAILLLFKIKYAGIISLISFPEQF
ncbi:MAG: hypothetical protein WCP70_07395 [Methanothrix sp.]